MTDETKGSNFANIDGNAPRFGSDLVASALRKQGFPYISLNPGASFRALHGSLVNFLGNEKPEIITCMHKEHAIGIAHGYAKITDTALPVAVLRNVDLMHATMGIFNAWCGRTPMLVIGATGPLDAVKRRPWIEWILTTIDQGSLVREYTKWDDQPGSAVAAVESIRRGVLLANARPSSPVYVCLDVGWQETELEPVPNFEEISEFKVPADSEPPQADFEEALRILSKAERPFIFCGRLSRSDEGWQDRVRLAELINARTTTHMKLPAALPSTHAAVVGETSWRLKGPVLEAIQSAAAILMLDWLDGGNAIKLAFPEGAPRPPVINVSNDFNIHNGWNMDYGALPAVDVNLATVPETTTRKLVEALEGIKGSVAKAELSRPAIAKQGTSGEIGLMDLALALAFAEVTKDEPMCITGRPLGWPSNANVIEHPHDFLGHTGGGGLGAGPSIAVGAALALREIKSDRNTVAILGDGDYMMGLTAIWNAATLKLPMLFLIANNHSYYNDENHQIKVAEKRGRPVERAPIGQRMEGPVPDLAALARAQGLEAKGPTTDLADLPAALENAIKRVHAGASFVLDVKVRAEYVTSSMADMS